MTRARIEFAGLPIWAFALLAAALLAWILWGYGRERGLVPPWIGRLLTALRGLAALLVLALFLNASLRRVHEEIERGQVLFLFDGSRSMDLRDEYRPAAQKLREATALGLLPVQQTEEKDRDAPIPVAVLERLAPLGRLELARAILGEGRPGSPLSALAERFRIAAATLQAGAEGTDLGQPVLDEALQRSRETLAAVVLVTDGRHNRGRSPEEVLRSLGALGIPLFCLGAGADEDPRDVRLAGVEAPAKVLAGDEVRVDLAVEARGMGALSLPIRISEGEKTVAELTAEILAGAGTTHIPASFAMPLAIPADGQPGGRKFTASFPAQEGEVAAANNSRDFWVNVLTEKVRVLLLDGRPRWEYRYLRNILGRDANVKIDSFLVTRPPERRLPPEFPRGAEPLFGYDVFILGDVEPGVFTAEELAAVRDFVSARGGSLVLVAGDRALPDEYAETPVEELLPVRLRRPRPSPGEGAALARTGLKLELTPEGERSPLTRLAPGREANRELWGLLPSMDWYAPVEGARTQASVLVRLAPELSGRAEAPAGGADEDSAARGVLMATLSVGAGRVFYSGVDSTWKWRYLAGDEYLARFWGQVVRWAAADRLPPGDGNVRIAAGEFRYEAPAEAKLRALLAGSDGKPIENARVDAVVKDISKGSERRVRLESIPKSGGLYRGSFETGPSAATYEVHVDTPDLAGYAARGDKARASFIVEEPASREAADLSRDGARLRELAKLAGPGGAYLSIDQAAELVRLVPDRSLKRERITTTPQWVLAWPVLIVFTLLVGAEWVVRKRFDLS